MDEKILCSLIKESEPIIYSIIRKYSSYSNEDLYQVGTIGVIKAYKKYKNDCGTKFSTYAYKYILGEIIAFIKKDRNIQISDDMFLIYKKYLKIKDLLFIKYEREATIEEISSLMNIDTKKLVGIIESVAFTKGVIDDEKYYQDDRESVDNRILLDSEFSSLDEFDKNIINYRYYMGYNQIETAQILGVSQAKVSREETLILKRLKNSIN